MPGFFDDGPNVFKNRETGRRGVVEVVAPPQPPARSRPSGWEICFEVAFGILAGLCTNPFEEERKRQAAKERKREKIVDRLRWVHDQFPHRAEDDFVEAYAQAHLPQLLAAKKKILASQRKLHRNVALVKRLRERHPALYRVATFHGRALGVAERHQVRAAIAGRAPVLLTNGEGAADAERRQSVESVAARGREALSVVEARIRAEQSARERFEAMGLDPDGIERAMQEFLDDFARRSDGPTPVERY